MSAGRLLDAEVRDATLPPGRLYVDGAWTDGSLGSSDVTDPATEEVVGTVAEASVADARAAASAARAAQPGWAIMPARDRARILSAVADGIRRRADDLVTLSMREGGFTRGMAAGNVDRAAGWFDFAADVTGRDLTVPTPPARARTMVQGHGARDELLNGVIQRRPVGVVACLVPFNAPFYGTSMKASQALATGNTVVVKPAQQNPLAICALFEILEEAGLPAGVANLVLGSDPEVAAELTRTPDVDMVSFTGSTAVGQKVYEAGSLTMKRLVLELGGKSACIVLPDADLDAAVAGLTHAWTVNSGQICTAPTRALVHASVYGRVVDRLAEFARTVRVGSPFDPATVAGPVISDVQRDRIEGHVASALDQGARAVVGGERPRLDRGWFVAPTLLAECHNQMDAVRAEIFGPVVAAIPFDSTDEAIAIANDTDYGLANYVYSTNRVAALDVAGQLQSGLVQVNTTAIKADMPRGGMKLSGIGREGGDLGLHMFTEPVSVVWA